MMSGGWSFDAVLYLVDGTKPGIQAKSVDPIGVLPLCDCVGYGGR